HGDVRHAVLRNTMQSGPDTRVVRGIVEHKEVYLPGVQECGRDPFEDAADVTLGVVREDEDEDAACAPGRGGWRRRINHALDTSEFWSPRSHTNNFGDHRARLDAPRMTTLRCMRLRRI